MEIKRDIIPKEAHLTLVDNQGIPDEIPIGATGTVVDSMNIDGVDYATVLWDNPESCGGCLYGHHKLDQFSNKALKGLSFACSQCNKRLNIEDISDEQVEAFSKDVVGLTAFKTILGCVSKAGWLILGDKPRTFGCRGISFKIKCNDCASKVVLSKK